MSRERIRTKEGQFKVTLCKKGVRHREKVISLSDECYYIPIILINDFFCFFFNYFFFGDEEKWRNLLQTLYRTLLGRVEACLLKPKTPSLEPIHRPRNRLSALNVAGIWFQLKFAH